MVTLFVPPHTAQLLGKKSPDFKFSDLDGKPVTPESLAGKVAVLDFWASDVAGASSAMETARTWRKSASWYKTNPKVAFYAVSVDRQQIKNSELAQGLRRD